MRKTYTTPTIEIIRIQPHQMLAMSDAALRSLDLNTDLEITDEATLL